MGKYIEKAECLCEKGGFNCIQKLFFVCKDDRCKNARL